MSSNKLCQQARSMCWEQVNSWGPYGHMLRALSWGQTLKKSSAPTEEPKAGRFGKDLSTQ